MLVILPAVYRHTSTEVRRTTKSGSTVSNSVTSRVGGYQRPQPLFTLVGKPIYLQQRFSVVPQNPEIISQIRNTNKTYSCFINDFLEKKKRETKSNTKRISGGVRRASIRRRQEQQKPSTEVVYQNKTKYKNRSVAIRQPLAMCTMNLPGKHMPRNGPYEEASQIFSSPEEAKTTLKRLLASRNHESMMSESVNTDGSRQEQENQSGLLEKSGYLEDTYDYLFQRHVQTLNGVIRQHEQEVGGESYGTYQQKHRKQVIQLCCGGGADGDDDTSVTIGSAKSSTRQNSSNVSHHSSRCHRVTGSKDHSAAQNDINSNFFGNEDASNDNKLLKEHCEEDEPKRGIDTNQIESCDCIQKNESSHESNSVDSETNVDLVTSKINEIKIQEVPSKPIITFNHVSTASENSATYSASEVTLTQTKTTLISSTFRSRSPSPLLEVPVPLADLTSEMMRPPIN